MAKSADFLGVAEPIYQYGYEAIFEKIGDSTLKFTESVTLPHMANSASTVKYRNSHKTIAGQYTHGTLTLSVKTVVSPNTALQVWKWYRLVYPKPGIVGHPKEYKAGGMISLVNGRGDPILTWQLQGCWPSSVKMGDGRNTSGGEFVLVELTIEVDDITGPN
jgi:hypothetical protein